jgi:hypothetical protein
VLRLGVELQRAAGRQIRKPLLDVPLDLPCRPAEERAEAPVEAKLATRVPDEVQHGQARLLAMEPQPAAELLEEHGRALRRTQEEDSVDARDVDALVEEVHGEECLDRALLQAADGGVALLGERLTGRRHARDARTREGARHEARVVDAHAEPEGAHALRVGDAPTDFLQHEPHARLGAVGKVPSRELVAVVAPAAFPRDVVEVDRVLHAEVLERREQSLLERVPQPHLVGGAPVEPAADILAIVALGGGGEPEQHARANVCQQTVVGGRLGVVEFVDDDDVEVVGGQLCFEVHA